jgi:hypothetical protein
VDKRESLIELYAKYLARPIPRRPYAIEPDPLQEILHEAAKRAGWRPPSAKARDRQRTAARARTVQRQQDLALRRCLVAYIFKTLRPGLKQKPSSTGTAQVIIGRLEKIGFKRLPTVRTVQEDISFFKKNGNWGI